MPRARRFLIPTAITAVKMLAVTTALADPATASRDCVRDVICTARHPQLRADNTVSTDPVAQLSRADGRSPAGSPQRLTACQPRAGPVVPQRLFNGCSDTTSVSMGIRSGCLSCAFR
jgi:hypothetical protein